MNKIVIFRTLLPWPRCRSEHTTKLMILPLIALIGLAGTIIPSSSADAPGQHTPEVSAFATPTIPLVTTGFVALSDTLDVIPPDSNGAINEDYVVTALNSQVRIQKKDGEQVKTTSISAFWTSTGAQTPFDPRTLYDRMAKRWIMVAVSNRGTDVASLLLGISATANPAGDWKLYRVLGNTTADAYLDFPTVAFNANNIGISLLVRATNGNQPVETRVYLFDKVELYTGGQGVPRMFRYRADALPVPAVAEGHTSQMVFLAAPLRTNAPVSELHVLTPDLTAGSTAMHLLNTFSNLPPWSAVAPNNGNFAPQLGSTQRIHLQESVIQNVVQKGERLWFSQMVFLPAAAPDRAAVQWGELTISNLTFLERIEDQTSESSYGYPSLAVNLADQICIGFTKFSRTAYASAACAIVPDRTKPADFVEVMLKPGEGPYYRTSGTGKNRWGDYSSTHVDPSDGFAFWTIQEYAALNQGDGNADGSGRWSTWWGQVRTPGARITQAFLESGLSLRVATAAGFSYQLEMAPSLTGEWTPLTAIQGGTDILIPNLQTDQRQRFFRVRHVVR